MLRLEINIEAVKAGHPDAWKDVYSKYWHSLVWFFLNKDWRRDESKAEDLAQVCLIKIYDNRHKLKSADHLQNMVYKIAKCQLSDAATWNQRHPIVYIDDMFDIPEEEVLEEQEEEVRLHELLVMVMEELAKMNKPYALAVIKNIECPDKRGSDKHYRDLCSARKKLAAMFGKRIYIH